MGSASVIRAKQVYYCMQSAAYNLVKPHFVASSIYFTDVQQDSTNVPSKYVIIKQFDTSLEPKSAGGNQRWQLATVIMELNYPKGEAEQARDLATEIKHYFSGTSFSALDIVIDSITSNGYDTTSGVKQVVVIDFNYIVRV